MAHAQSKLSQSEMKKITDDYFIFKDQILGDGGFGYVFKGYCKSRNQYIAIKMPKQYKDNKNKQQFDKQLRTFKQLSNLIHPNIISLYGFQLSSQKAFLFMQYCPNTLHKAIHQDKDLNELQVLKYLIQIVKGMCYMNSKNIIHRDLKPQNILIDSKNKIKITDFGLARMNMNDIKKSIGCGTIIYMPPQILFSNQNDQQNKKQLHQKSYINQNDPKIKMQKKTRIQNQSQKSVKKYTQNCDVWSLGIILYQMLARKRLFPNQYLVAQQYQKFNNSQKRVEYDQNIHPLWEYLTNLMLTYDHTKRVNNYELLKLLNIAFPIMQLDLLNNDYNNSKNEKIIKLQNFINFSKQKFDIYYKIIDTYKAQDIFLQSPAIRVIRLISLCILLKKIKNLICQLKNRDISIFYQQQLYIQDQFKQCQLDLYMRKYQLDLEITHKYYFNIVSQNIYQNIQPVIDRIDEKIITDFQKGSLNAEKFYRKYLAQIINQLNYTSQELKSGSQQFLSFYLRILVVLKEQKIFSNLLYERKNFVKDYIQNCLAGSKQEIILKIVSL